MYSSTLILVFLLICTLFAILPAQGLNRKVRDIIRIEDQTKTFHLLDLNETVNGQYHYPCYVLVGAFNTDQDQTPIVNADVYVLTREPNETNNFQYFGWGNKYLGYRKEKTGKNGFACVSTLCFKEALIFVEDKSERIYNSGNQNNLLPKRYFFRAQTRREEVVFDPRNRGFIGGKSGPVYRKTDKSICTSASTQSSWYFKFVHLSVPDRLDKVEPLYHEALSWYDSSPNENTYKTCFFKVTVITTSYGIEMVATSRNSKGELYGTYHTGPKENPQSTDKLTRAACVEYRCPTDSNVMVKVELKNNGSTPCFPNPTFASRKLKADLKPNQFEVIFHPRDNYGPQDGVYVANGNSLAREVALSRCLVGSNDYTSGFVSDPSKQPLVKYTCSGSSGSSTKPPALVTIFG